MFDSPKFDALRWQTVRMNILPQERRACIFPPFERKAACATRMRMDLSPYDMFMEIDVSYQARVCHLKTEERMASQMYSYKSIEHIEREAEHKLRRMRW